MRSPDAGSWRLLLGKERRELASSRAWLLLLVVLGPLVGVAFITAEHGIVVPTFGAYAIVVTLLLPLVAVRLVSSEKQSGALTLLLQARTSLGAMLAIKLLALVLAWLLAWLPGLTALVLWRSYGGALPAPAIAAMLAGQLLRATLICAIAIASAALIDNTAIAVIVTLALSLATWALDLIGVPGSLALGLDVSTWQVALRTFERGELRLSLVLVTLILTFGAMLFSWVWLPSSRTRRHRMLFTVPITAGVALLVFAAGQLPQRLDFTGLAGITPRAEAASAHSPYPLPTQGWIAAVIFYLVWPSLVIGLWWMSRRTPVPQNS